MDDLFGLSDLAADSGQRTAARWVARALAVVFFSLSSLTTAAFFYTYAPALGQLFGPELAPYVAALMGVLCLDAGALAWGYVRTHAATTREQMTLAAIVAGADLIGSLLVSGLYVVLSGGLDVGVTTASGQLSELGQALHILGTAVITGGLILNFASVAIWANVGADTRKAAQATGLQATITEGHYRVSDARARATVNKTLGELGQRLPELTDRAAAANAASYLRQISRPYQTPDNGPSGPQSTGDIQPERATERPHGAIQGQQAGRHSTNGAGADFFS